MNELDLFAAAIAIMDPSERADLLERECVGRPDLRRRIDLLLDAHIKTYPLLDPPGPDQTSANGGPVSATALHRTVAKAAGTVIAGRYKLLQQIGERGMGSVWMADQTEPVKRRVAVKLIQIERGNTKTILSRFEAEQQAIALMDHPHIARLLDAGTTDDGSPFFVMELVKGIPLSDFCDEHKLSIRDRLQIFIQICSAVQHAHQKGIIHRDLKPTNILIESHDGKPVPKVIDFGLAKATSGIQLGANTLFTAFGSVMGTPLYMAPEQANFNAVDVDTRADVYALGVILYELLTGTTPITRESMQKAAFDEILKLIREQDAPAPSSRLSRVESAPSVAANRRMEPRKLGRFVKGELDWIVMKALSKERDRRYETPNGIGRDVERFLNNEPVTAGPPSTSYRLRKFVIRNRGQVVAAGLVFLALLAGMAGTTWGLVEALRSADAERLAKADANAKRHEAESNLAFATQGNAILGSVFEGLDPQANYATAAELRGALRSNLKRAVEELDSAAIGNPLIVAAMQNTLGCSLLGLREAKMAIVVLEKAAETRKAELGPTNPLTLHSINNLALAYKLAGKLDLALPLFEETLKRKKTLLGADDPDTLTSMNNLASAYKSAGKLRLAVPLFEETLKLRKATLGAEHPDTLTSMNNLALAYMSAGKLEPALPLFELTLKLQRAKLGAEHPDTLATMNNLALAYMSAGKLELALPLCEETLKLRKATLSAEHPDTLTSMNNLASAYKSAGKPELALPLFEETLKLRKATLGAEHPDTLTSMNNLASAYESAGKLDLALPLCEETLKLCKTKLGPEHPDTLTSMNNLALTYEAAGKLDLALPLFEETLKLRKAKLGSGNPMTLATMTSLFVVYGEAGATVKSTQLLADARQQLPKGSPQLAQALELNGSNLLKAKAFAAAEPLLHECLAIRETTQPDHWTTFDAQSLLGASMLGQNRYTDAEPLLVKGYEGMKQREMSIPPHVRKNLRNALDRLIELYTAANRPDEAKKWQAEKAMYSKTRVAEKK